MSILKKKCLMDNEALFCMYRKDSYGDLVWLCIV